MTYDSSRPYCDERGDCLCCKEHEVPLLEGPLYCTTGCVSSGCRLGRYADRPVPSRPTFRPAGTRYGPTLEVFRPGTGLSPELPDDAVAVGLLYQDQSALLGIAAPATAGEVLAEAGHASEQFSAP